MEILNWIINFILGFFKWFFVFCVAVSFPYLFVGSLIVVGIMMKSWQVNRSAYLDRCTDRTDRTLYPNG
tara:strand:- start:247 stop:453 length:207 start_codon:yes stop_codon:yes gene_type:complete